MGRMVVFAVQTTVSPMISADGGGCARVGTARLS